MLSLCGPSGIRAAWPQGRGVVCLDSRPQAGSFPHHPCPAVPRPLLFFLGFCPVCTVIGPREGCGLVGALHRAWAASRPGWPTPGPPVTAPSQAGSPPSCPAETGPGRAQWQAVCDAPVAMVILDKKAIAFCFWNLHPSDQLCSACRRRWLSVGGLESTGSTAVKVSSRHPPSLGPPFNPNRDHYPNW